MNTRETPNDVMNNTYCTTHTSVRREIHHTSSTSMKSLIRPHFIPTRQMRDHSTVCPKRQQYRKQIVLLCCVMFTQLTAVKMFSSSLHKNTMNTNQTRLNSCNTHIFRNIVFMIPCHFWLLSVRNSLYQVQKKNPHLCTNILITVENTDLDLFKDFVSK